MYIDQDVAGTAFKRQSSYAGGAKRSFNWRRQPPATTEKEIK